MTVPILRDVQLFRPRTGHEVAVPIPYDFIWWCGRAGAAAICTVTVNELQPNGLVGPTESGPGVATAGVTGRYSYRIASVLPGKYYRVKIDAADPALPADKASETYRFTATPA